jgi:RND family efflux transporter MFP subunit
LLPQTVAVATLLAALAGCARTAPPVVAPPPPEVVVTRPVVAEVTDTIEFTGNATAVETVDLKPRVGGFVTAVHFEDGQDVSVGDKLFDIDDRTYRIARDQAQAEIEREQAELAELESERVRNEALLPRGAVTQEQVGIITAKRDMAAATLKKDMAMLAQAELDLDFCRVTAPIAGRIGARTVSVGDLVGGGAAPTTLATIVSVDPVYVTFFADERSLLVARERAIAARRGGVGGRAANEETSWRDIRDLAIPVDVALVTDEGFPRRGVLAFVDIAVRASTGTIRCRAILDNPDRLIAPGMFCRVRLPFGDPAEALLVPDRAIGIEQGRRTVAVVGADDRVTIREIIPGKLDGQMRVVTEGLATGDRVIVSGLQRVRDGAVVRPVEAQQAPPARE